MTIILILGSLVILLALTQWLLMYLNGRAQDRRMEAYNQEHNNEGHSCHTGERAHSDREDKYAEAEKWMYNK